MNLMNLKDKFLEILNINF